MESRPDVLVLGGGGVLGEAWMTGVLAGIEDASGFDLRGCEHFVGTSAGAIIAVRLAAGESPRRPPAGARPGSEPAREDGAATGLAAALGDATRIALAWAGVAGAAVAPSALGLTARGGALLRAAVLQALPRPAATLARLRSETEALGLRFDGRLRIVAVNRRTGRRVVFGRPGAPRASVAQAVAASCAVPWLFAPVRIGGSEYVDGGVWSATNLDTAPAGRETHVLCLNPTAGLTSANTLAAVARNIARSAVSLEALALRHRGAAVQTLTPNAESGAAMGPDFMDREPSGRVLEAGYRQGLRFARRG